MVSFQDAPDENIEYDENMNYKISSSFLKGPKVRTIEEESALQKWGIIDQIVLAIGKSEGRSDANVYTWQSNNSSVLQFRLIRSDECKNDGKSEKQKAKTTRRF